MANFHEDFGGHTETKQSSDRSFGIVFAVFFALYGWLLPVWRSRPVRWWAVWLSGAFLLVTLVRPTLLHFANVLWGKLGMLLGRVMNPVVTGLLFYVVITPSALLLRLMGKDLLRLRWAPNDQTYWITRRTPGPDPKTMANQF